MSNNIKRPHLIAYDIACPRRLYRVHRALTDQGVPLQYSVFLCILNNASRDKLINTLEQYIDKKQDDIRIYPLPLKPWFICYGKGSRPEGHNLSGLDDGGILSNTPHQLSYTEDSCCPPLQDHDKNRVTGKSG